uniref:Uncharacterized protein n=1 Tax=Arundo donax TaxID=35708 RepID=A0A0A9AMN9_ARUDO
MAATSDISVLKLPLKFLIAHSR